MKINEIIKEKRKAQDLTQEQIAEYLGVSTPAVNKWEKGITYPDITILPALARLLKVDLNTLLSFNEDLSEQEIVDFINKMVNIIQKEDFVRGFKTGIEHIQKYPNSDALIIAVALALQGSLFIFGSENKKLYEGEIEKLYMRVSNSEDIEIQNQANSMLISKYMEREEYEKAQHLIDTLPNFPFHKNQIQSNLYIKQGKLKEASELLEGKLLKAANEIQSILLLMMEIAQKENRLDDALYYADISEDTAKLYDLWSYSSYVAHFQLAVFQKDTKKCIGILKSILPVLKERWNINNAKLYKHIKEKDDEGLFGNIMLQGLITELQNEKEFNFLKSNTEFLELLDRYRVEK